MDFLIFGPPTVPRNATLPLSSKTGSVNEIQLWPASPGTGESNVTRRCGGFPGSPTKTPAPLMAAPLPAGFGLVQVASNAICPALLIEGTPKPLKIEPLRISPSTPAPGTAAPV